MFTLYKSLTYYIGSINFTYSNKMKQSLAAVISAKLASYHVRVKEKRLRDRESDKDHQYTWRAV